MPRKNVRPKVRKAALKKALADPRFHSNPPRHLMDPEARRALDTIIAAVVLGEYDQDRSDDAAALPDPE